MKILEYTNLDTSRVKASYRKIIAAISQDDFRAAQVKKMSHLSHGKFYRAKLDDSNRLLFTLLRHENEVYALILEVILNHDYDKSRFLRGAQIDEEKIVDADLPQAIAEAMPMRYLNPAINTVHLLDKPISFDEVQQAVYRHAAPLIVVGSAGSGKTALTLEKLKCVAGEVLYVTHSAFLAKNAGDLYYSNGFEHDSQEASFLSYREFIESLRVPNGREAHWRDFSAWFARSAQSFKELDAHQVFEEIRGVLTAQAQGVLSRAAYLSLGVRQSIYPENQREKLYDVFEKYRAWLTESKLYDLNLVAQEWQTLATPQYDFIVIDEVQDLTNVQLALILKTLKKPGQFLLCGDSNQIVHPNFFSWSQVKSLFWQDPQLAERQQLQVLSSNFRNGLEATRVANQLLKIKHRRFGSIDRESNFLVQAVGGEAGQVALVPDDIKVKRELDQKIRHSTQFAVLVMRDEDKAAARQHFSTPLLFSIHEAKGLEYENIVLYRFVTDHRAEFAEIVNGVAAADLRVDELSYKRAKDKGDKSLEVYKFFVNALYVALTRAIKNLYLVEADGKHALFDLLAIDSGNANVQVQKSSMEDWQKEARKLELQGKQEQADAIRRGILKQTPVPWPVLDSAKVTELLHKVFTPHAVVSNKLKQQLFDYACYFNHSVLAQYLQQGAKFEPAKSFAAQRETLARKSYAAYFLKNSKEILRQCEQYGIDHRLTMDQTPLIAATCAGNLPLVEQLLERGADREACDHFGCNALHWGLLTATNNPQYAREQFPALYERLAPPFIDLKSGDRLVRIDKHKAEYFLFQTMWAHFRARFTANASMHSTGFDVKLLLSIWESMTFGVLRQERRRPQYISSVLARNEVEREYAYNRSLFKRQTVGKYQLNPQLSIRVRHGEQESWMPIYEVLNLTLISQFANCSPHRMRAVADHLAAAGMAAYSPPIGAMQQAQ